MSLLSVFIVVGFAGSALAATAPEPGSNTPENDGNPAACKKGEGALPIPTWYKYLPGETVNGACKVKAEFNGATIVLVIMAIFDIVLFLAGVVAVVMVIYGGFKLLISNGEPQKIAAGRTTIANALVGLVIAIVASQVVGFIAGRLS